VIYSGTENSGLGDLYREWNLLDAASVEIQKGIDLAEAGDHIFYLIDVYLARVHLALTQRDWEAALSYLRKAEGVARRSPTSIEIAHLLAWRARLNLAQGKLAEAIAWAESIAAEQPTPLNPQQEFALLTLARIWLAQGKTSQAASLLERVRLGAENAGRGGRALEAQMLAALAAQALGEETQAIAQLSRVLARAEPEGYLRLMADGCANKEIAAKLFISVGTVKRHIVHILQKLAAANRTQAVTIARELEII
jgi:LuxR family maltose regulon positive regulatory protein